MQFARSVQGFSGWLAHGACNSSFESPVHTTTLMINAGDIALGGACSEAKQARVFLVETVSTQVVLALANGEGSVTSN